ncbi:MAG: InlB B-repeat-containing protein [Kiritimatiellae bacterium]|nr:InlB B-repeat-containing protein [Kiritimatiellia bacterium]
MKKVSRTLRSMLILAMSLVNLMPAYAETEYVDGYTWSYSIQGDVARTGGYILWSSEFCGEVPAVSPNPIGSLSIPSTLGGKPVAIISWYVVAHCDNLTIVTVPSSVTNMHARAFEFCDGIERLDFKGKPPVVPGFFDAIWCSASVGTYQPEYEAEWKAVMDYNGRWYGLKMQMFGTSHVITFNPNGGKGTIDVQTFEEGQEQKLSKNTYCKDGCLFQGWAVTADGEVIYKDEAEIIVDSDMTLYAVWANRTLKLAAESADWSLGSITLRCEDSDTSGAEHEYTLEYKNASEAWEEVDGAKNKLATRGQNASGQAVLVVQLTDNAFWSRLGGLPPVEYRVKDENGRVSEGRVTRNRHGLYVGVGEYEDGEKRGLPSLPFAPSDASKFKGIAEKHAKFSGRPVYANHDATIEAVDAALGDLVDCSQSGDICLFYITTHGGYDGKDGLICLYDGDYTHSALTEKVSRMADKGIAFIAVVGTCHAEAMLQMDFPNAAVVAAATMETLSTATFDEIFMYDGWEDCCAAPGPTMTFENLADYAIEKYNSLFGGIDFLDEDAEECYPYRMSATKNDVGGLLGKIVARTDCTSDFDIATKPSVVSGFSATTNDSEKIGVSWNAVQGAERYYLFYGRLGNPQFLGYKVIEIDDGTSCAFGIDKDWVKESSKTAPVRFMVKAYNVAGVSPAAVATGWRYRTFSIIFYTIDHERVDWDEPSFNRYKDDEVVKCVEYGDEYILKCLPKAKKPGYYLKGWYDLNDNEAVAGLTLNSDAMYHAEWREIAMPQIWLDEHVDIVEHSGGDLATAAAMTAANGTRTVDECYRLGIDPEDPDDDLKIAEFKMNDGKPEITLNHTKDGSGNSFEDRVKILGKAELTDAEWQEVPPEGNPAHRFFTVDVEMP